MQATLTAYASLSNHNSDQDDADRAAWADFARKVSMLLVAMPLKALLRRVEDKEGSK